MGKDDNAAVTWFRRSLMFHKLEPREITSGDALGESFKSFSVGLTLFLGILALILLFRTNTKVDTGQLVELSGFLLVPLINAACLSLILFGFLWVLRIGTPFESAVIVCCSALGGLLPVVGVGMGVFLDRAVQLSIEHGDPSLPYLKAAIYQVLFEEQGVLTFKVISWLGVAISLTAIAWYIGWLVVLLSKVSRRGNRALVALAAVSAWMLDGIFVTHALGFVFWRLIIQQAVGHHG